MTLLNIGLVLGMNVCFLKSLNKICNPLNDLACLFVVYNNFSSKTGEVPANCETISFLTLNVFLAKTLLNKNRAMEVLARFRR